MELRKLIKETSFHQENKRLRELFNMSESRTLTFVEDREGCHRRVEQDKLNMHCTCDYGFKKNPNKTERFNSIRMIGDKSKKEYFNECNNM